jgi:hypothetical protein
VVHQRREAQAAVFHRDVEAEELVLLAVVPDLRRQVGADVGDVPVVGHAAERFARAVEEGLFLRGELRLGQREQLVPVGLAGEQLAFEAHGARFERGAFGVRERGQQLRIEGEQRRGDARLAERRDEQGDRDRRDQQCRDDGGRGVRTEQPRHDEEAGRDRRPIREPQPVVGRETAGEDQQKEGNDDAH